MSFSKGQKQPLLHTLKSRQRIVVGLSWGARADKTTLMDRIRGTDQQHDLDISCFVFNHAGEYIDFIGAMAQDSMDQTGCIYHSGDDATGEGDGDDEAISCELAGLPVDTTHLIFVTEIRSDHVFGNVAEPCVRIADGMTNNNLLEFDLATDQGKNAQACVMVRIYRDRALPTGWAIHYIDEYPDLSKVEDWSEYIKRYL